MLERGSTSSRIERGYFRNNQQIQQQIRSTIGKYKSMNFGVNKLKSGSGEQVIYTLNKLADEAMRTKGFEWRE